MGAVGVGGQCTKSGGVIVAFVANGDHRPQCRRKSRCNAQLFLGGFDAAVDRCAVLLCIGGDVDIGHRAEHAVDALGLGLESRCHYGLLTPAGGKEDAGSHAQAGINLPDQLDAGLLAGQRIHTAHNVGGGDAVRLEALAGHLEGAGLCRGVVQNNDVDRTVVRMAGQVILTSDQGRFRILHHERVQQHIGLVVPQGAVGLDSDFLFRVGGGVGGLVGVQHIDQDDRRHVENTEAVVHALAQGEVLEVIRVPKVILALSEGVAQNGFVDGGCRIVHHMDGCSPKNDL